MILAFPFRLAGNAASVVDEDSTEGLAQAVALLATTRKGERQLFPAYGIGDPVFSAYNVAEINAGLAMFGPDVEVTGVVVTPTSQTEERVTIGFWPRGGRP